MPSAVAALDLILQNWDAHFGDPEAAHARALMLHESASGDERVIAWAELTIAYCHLSGAIRPAEARDWLARAQARLQRLADPRGELLARIGAARLHAIEHPAAARDDLLALYPEACEILPPQDRFYVVNALATTYFHTDRIDEAIRYLYEALETLRGIPPSKQLAAVIAGLAALLVDAGDFASAAELAAEAIGCLTQNENPALWLSAHASYVEALLGLSDSQAALAVADAMFSAPTTATRTVAQNQHCAAAAETYAKQGRLRDAQLCVVNAREIYDEHRGGFNEVHYRWAAATLADACNVGDGTLAALELAADAAVRLAHLPTLCKAHERLAQRYAALGRFEEAYRHQCALLTAQTRRLTNRASAKYYLSLAQHELANARAQRERVERERIEMNVLKHILDQVNRELAQKIAEVEELQSRLSAEAIRDPLTQLFNRRYLDSVSPGLVASAKRRNSPLAVALVDLDHFKRVNDRFGHPAGDMVLAHVGRLLAASLRPSDVVCRWGGEEFCVLFPDTGAAGAETALKMLASKIALLSLPWESAQIANFSFSAGVAVMPVHGVEFAVLLAAADRALYAAKDAGRARVVVASQGA